MTRDYAIYDVFTATKLEGNPLAVVFDADGLSDTDMAAIAGEFNLSETIFLVSPENDSHSAAARIFTPKSELPFAGHPTVGATVAIIERRGGLAGDGRIVTLEEGVGLVRCVVKDDQGTHFAEFDLPKLPVAAELTLEKEEIAEALGLSAAEIGFENHVPTLYSAGVPFLCVPVDGLEAIGRASTNTDGWPAFSKRSGFGEVYLYTRDTIRHDASYHVRLFAPAFGIAEDPATGAAAAAFAGVIMEFDAPHDGPHIVLIEQGVEMGRPSALRLELDVENRKLTKARLGGHAVKIAEGKLLL
ncbi:PhzF family phenazine biosynthesis isomerase [Notoacmeibacter sp. MSK16QG-6]|uniref:PhzF family phenazine biosynthesis protein n=1 Tax=Notoacmeibacter sp. MSK16QG-6 TaxID=2957982 RepID=UPI0020A123FE|nr:PhzF family phenazine biosynthesis protein [Notoacmeibacter sp. MSK16QG-6]